MGVTIKDVARKVGVTPATVSMVINNKPRISEGTRRRVQEAIQELDYYPHEGARSLVLQRTNTLGVAAPFFTSYFVLETLSGIEQEVRQSDFNLVLYGTRGLSKTVDAVITRIARERKVDGLITINLALTPKQVRYFQKNNIQLVCLEYETDGCDCVMVDNAQGAYQAGRHLAALGHRRIALVGAPADVPSVRQREEGFRKALHEAGVPFDPALRVEAVCFTRDEGFDAGRRLLRLSPRPTAVFVAAGDVCATGLLLAAKREGLVVPRDLSVVGFDDQPFSELVEPALTTVRQPMGRMGREAFHLLRDALKEPKEHTICRRSFATELVTRQSTAAPFGPAA